MIWVLDFAAIALGLMYLAAAALRFMVLRTRLDNHPDLRRAYKISVVVCLGLSLNAWRLLWTGTVSSTWAIFGLSCALVAVHVVYIKPAVTLLKLPPLRPMKQADAP